MSEISMAKIASTMKDIDFCMMSTRVSGKGITSRPMSNNRDVEYNGDAWYFASEDSGKIREIRADSSVCTVFQGKNKGDAPGAFISVEGRAEIVTDKAVMKQHWYDALKMWFPEGLETEGIALIKVRAKDIRWWDGQDSGVLDVR